MVLNYLPNLLPFVASYIESINFKLFVFCHNLDPNLFFGFHLILKQLRKTFFNIGKSNIDKIEPKDFHSNPQ